MIAVTWSALGLLAAALFGSFFYFGTKFDAVGHKFDVLEHNLRQEFRADIGAFRQEVKADLNSLKVELKGEITALRSDFMSHVEHHTR